VHASVSKERRHSERSAVDLPIQLCCAGGIYDARTVDVSADGVAAVSAGEPHVHAGDEINFTFTLQHLTDESPSCLEGDGVVVRVQPCAGGMLIAFRAQCLSLFPAAAVVPCGAPS
jgi:hypothetical protein